MLKIGVALALVWMASAHAEIRMLGPTPYQSTHDSLFDLSGLGESFFLEDFEDGDWDRQGGIIPGAGEIRSPSPDTDSVDGDDGVIDGRGNTGHSFRPVGFTTRPTTPLQFVSELQFGLIRNNAFGFVWTDALNVEPRATLEILVRTVDGEQRHFFVDGSDVFGSSYGGETEEDRFIGFSSDSYLTFVQIFSISTDSGYDNIGERFEIDHVQFGTQAFVPEPNFNCGLLLVLLMLIRR